jgi:hypothetical protein
MSDVILLLDPSSFSVAAQALRLNSSLIIGHPSLDIYRVQTAVSRVETFGGFVRAIEDGSELSVTADKLRVACDHFIRPPIDFRSESTGFGLGEQGGKLVVEVGLFRQDREVIRKLEREDKALRTEVQEVKN